MPTTRPIITFTTDFGSSDAYVAEMKGAALRICPDANLIDITHGIAPQDILGGSIALQRGVSAFPPGTIHVGVVDPLVGTHRKMLAAHVDGQIVLAPDNGLITWTYRLANRITTQELLFRPVGRASNTFHGRDIFAPAAALIASGQGDAVPLGKLDHPTLLDFAPAQSLDEAIVIRIDHYGNVITNVPESLITPDTYLLDIGPVRRTYGDVAIGEPVALISSNGLLEIAVRNQNAASQLDLAVGSKVRFRS